MDYVNGLENQCKDLQIELKSAKSRCDGIVARLESQLTEACEGKRMQEEQFQLLKQRFQELNREFVELKGTPGTSFAVCAHLCTGTCTCMRTNT